MKGAQNGPADALSRLHAKALHVEPNVIINFKELAGTQENDIELVQLKSSPSSLILRDVPLLMSNSTIVCNVLTDVPCPYVPPNFKHAVLTRFIHSHILVFGQRNVWS